MRESLVSRHMNHTIRWCVSFVMAFVCLSSLALAQDKKDKPVEDITLESPADRWPLKVTYYRSSEGKEAAVVVLMHMKGESRLTWTAPKGFAEQLNAKGFAVIAMDLRKHGQSKPGAENDAKSSTSSDKSKKSSSGSDLKPTDYLLMIRDMDAIKKMIFEEHQKGNLNMRKTAIVAPTMSAAIAITFAVSDWAKPPYNDAPTLAQKTPRGQDVQAMVFLSPETSLPQVPAHQIVGQLKATPMASFVVVGGSDNQDKDQAKKLFQLLGGDPAKTEASKKKTDKNAEKTTDKSEDRFFYGELKGVKLRGTDLLGKNLRIEEAMIAFLEDHVKSLKGPVYEWRDRQSPLTE